MLFLIHAGGFIGIGNKLDLGSFGPSIGLDRITPYI